MLNYNVNYDSFEKFLSNSIVQQRVYLKEHPEQKESIIHLAQSYLTSMTNEPAKKDLKLKAWLLLPQNKVTNIKFENRTSINSAFENEVIKSVLEANDYWRIKQLKQWGINFDAKLDNKKTPLHLACELGDLTMAIKLLELNVDLQAQDSEGLTPLELACRHGHMMLVLHLLDFDSNASLYKMNSQGKTPIHYLCEKNEEKAIKLLKLMNSPITTAYLLSKLDLDSLAQHLIDEIQDIKERTDLLHILLKADKFNIKLIEYTLKKGVDFKQLDEEGSSLFYNCLLQNSVETVKLLLDNGANINEPLSSDGYTPLHVAALTLTPEILNLLLERGANVNAQESSGKTPLHLAAKDNDEEKIESLIAYKADLDAIDNNGISCRWLIKILGTNVSLEPPTTRRDDEFELRFLLANLWSIEKQTTLGGKSFSLEGMSGGLGLGPISLIELFKQFKDLMKESIDLDAASELIESSYDRSHEDLKTIIKKFKNRESIVSDTGWFEHAISVSFIDDYMLVCNRGSQRRKETAIKMYKIDRNLPLNEEDFLFLKEKPKEEEGSKFFYQTLPAKLGYDASKQDIICRMIEKKCQQKPQKIGNCWWTSPKSGILGILAVKSLLELDLYAYKTEKEKEKACGEIIDAFQKVYKYFTEFTRIEMLKRYLERPPNGVDRDHALVKEVAAKFHSRQWKYIFENTGAMERVYAFLKKSLGMTTNNLPPLYKKYEVEGWLEDYKTKFNLDHNFDPHGPEWELMYIG